MRIDLSVPINGFSRSVTAWPRQPRQVLAGATAFSRALVCDVKNENRNEPHDRK